MKTKPSELQKMPHPGKSVYQELFDNGYGISVVSEADGSSYEVGVLKHIDQKWVGLTYETPITDDVIRFCSANIVDYLKEKIRNLPSNSN